MAIDPTGGCQCGRVRYKLHTDACVVYACHCRECQKQSASAFGLSLPVAKNDIEIRGPLRFYERETDSGRRSKCYFCPDCGTRIYHCSGASRGRITVKGGTLDDPFAMKPVAHLWVRSKLPWVVVPDSVPTYQTQPDDLDQWRESLRPA